MADEHKAVLEAWVDAVNRHDLDAALGCYAPDYTDHSSGHEESGIEALQAACVEMFRAFPDLEYMSEDVIAAGDKLVERFSSRGTHQGELMGVPPTGRQVTITGINIFRVVDGKIVDRWAQVDDLGMMQQLGLVPTGHHSHT